MAPKILFGVSGGFAMKILVLSNAVWSDNNCFGNSFSNIFDNITGIETANIFCSSGAPYNRIVKRYFQITEKSLLRNLKTKSVSSGKEMIHSENQKKQVYTSTNKFISFAKSNRAIVFFWIRDLIWKIGRWKSNELKKFIDDFEPDVLFMPLYYSAYLNDIAQFIKQYTGKPMFGYVSDDIYTMRQFSLSPLYWINRLYIRPKIKRTVKECEHLYVISDIQKQEYEKCFHKECKLLWKGAEFKNKPNKKQIGQPVKLVYTGNIGVGRYKQLASIGQVIAKLNSEKKRAELDIYTMTPMSQKMKRAVAVPNAINLKGGISPEEVVKVQNEADILVHVESFDLKTDWRYISHFQPK